MPDKTNDNIRPGPARLAPNPDITKIPAPITAPTPSAVSWKAPKVRFRLCSPDSLASANSDVSVLVANRFAIVCSLRPTINLLNHNPPCSRPCVVHRNPQQDDDQSRPGKLRLITQQHNINK